MFAVLALLVSGCAAMHEREWSGCAVGDGLLDGAAVGSLVLEGSREAAGRGRVREWAFRQVADRSRPLMRTPLRRQR
jgi:hypothetical protein